METTPRRPDILAYGALATFLVALIGFFFVEIPPANKDTIGILVGALIMVVKDVYGFDFNTTRSSATKDATINDMAKKGTGS